MTLSKQVSTALSFTEKFLKDLDSQEIAALFFQIVEAVEEIDKH